MIEYKTDATKGKYNIEVETDNYKYYRIIEEFVRMFIDHKLDFINIDGGVDDETDKGWISVKDRLPKTNVFGIAHILVHDYYEGIVQAVFLDESANHINGSNIFVISNTSTQLYKVTHWMPLPKPPRSKK